MVNENEMKRCKFCLYADPTTEETFIRCWKIGARIWADSQGCRFWEDKSDVF